VRKEIVEPEEPVEAEEVDVVLTNRAALSQDYV
jgi:hypothetical protein